MFTQIVVFIYSMYILFLYAPPSWIDMINFQWTNSNFWQAPFRYISFWRKNIFKALTQQLHLPGKKCWQSISGPKVASSVLASPAKTCLSWAMCLSRPEIRGADSGRARDGAGGEAGGLPIQEGGRGWGGIKDVLNSLRNWLIYPDNFW